MSTLTMRQWVQGRLVWCRVHSHTCTSALLTCKSMRRPALPCPADVSQYAATPYHDLLMQVMEMLHTLFSLYDELCHVHGVYKVETIGE